jgi:diguanylate cyclase (GGDEF)-like protein
LACIASHVAPSAGETSQSQGGCVAVSGYFADVFLKPNDSEALRKVTNAASRWLGMDADSTAAVLEKMGECAGEFEDLFDLPLIAVGHAEAIVDQAKELVMIASLGKLRELEEKAQRDALTGAHNRQYFDETFNQEFAAANRHGWPLSVAFIDIDHFKLVNDTYGHAAGDNALVTLSRLISSQIRNGDIFARYGGEEFVLLFPGTASDAAWIVLSRIREAIASFVHTFGDATFSLSISAGLASHKNGSLAYELPEKLLRAADNALYAAKRMGRNQVVIAESAPIVLT